MHENYPNVLDEKIEPEILREMRIPRLIIPDEFKPHLTEQDLEDLEKRDRRVILTISVIDQKSNFIMAWIQAINHHTRILEAQQIRNRRALADQVEINWNWKIIKWVGLVLGAGAASAFMREVFQRAFQ